MNRFILRTPSLITSLERSSEDTPLFATVQQPLSSSSLGPVEEGTAVKVEVNVTAQERARLERVEARPPLSEILNLHDFEVCLCPRDTHNLLPSNCISKAIARLTMPEKAWAYYSSASDDEITNRENHAAFHRSVSGWKLADLDPRDDAHDVVAQDLVQATDSS